MNKETINPRRFLYVENHANAKAYMTYVYKNRERHIVLILRLETGDFDFRIKQKTLSYVNTGPFLQSVYCKDTFFVQYDALSWAYF